MFQSDHKQNEENMKIIADALIATYQKDLSVEEMLEILRKQNQRVINNAASNDEIIVLLRQVKTNRNDLEDAKQLTQRASVDIEQEIYNLDKKRNDLLIDTYGVQVASAYLVRKLSRKITSWSFVQQKLLESYFAQ